MLNIGSSQTKKSKSKKKRMSRSRKRNQDNYTEYENSRLNIIATPGKLLLLARLC